MQEHGLSFYHAVHVLLAIPFYMALIVGEGISFITQRMFSQSIVVPHVLSNIPTRLLVLGWEYVYSCRA